MAPDIRTTATRIVYENRWMRVREDAIERRDGSRGIYGVVEKTDFAVIAPIDDGVTAVSMRREIAELIGFIEEAKIRFLRGELRASELYREVGFGLHQFEMRYRGFDCSENRVFHSYFSASAAGK